MKKDKTILEKIGIRDEIAKKWKKKGLKITYPTRARTRFLKSDDGEIFIENGDKFVPPLSKEETRIYKRYPEKFREDFLKNVRFYIKFCNFIYKTQKKVERLKNKEKIAGLLSLIYLFQRAMDYHYYHWDRYLVYQNYPSTPVGYWWKRLRDLSTKIKLTKKKVIRNRSSEDFLKLLMGDKEIFKKFKKNLSKRDFLKLKQSLKAIKIFENSQQKEVDLVIDFRRREEIFVRTAFPMWNKLCEEIKKHPELIKKRNISEIKKIINIHPVIAIRKIMLQKTLRCYDDEVFSQFKREIKRWL